MSQGIMVMTRHLDDMIEELRLEAFNPSPKRLISLHGRFKTKVKSLRGDVVQVNRFIKELSNQYFSMDMHFPKKSGLEEAESVCET